MMVKLSLMPIFTYFCFVQSQSPCTTPDGKNGICKRIDKCEPLHKLAQESGTVQPDSLNHLQKSICGFEEVTVAKVCCPTCLTLENKEVVGQCLNVFECDHIKKGLTTPPVTQQYRHYVKSLRCQGRLNICCGPPLDSEPVTSTPRPASGTHLNTDCKLSAQPPDSTGSCCGHHEFNGVTKFNGHRETNINEYPWLALIEYRKEDHVAMLCGGALISGRYVLTAGHCVLGNVLRVGAPTNVRLGEHNTTNEGKDCMENDDGYFDCNLDPVVIPIEQIIPHREYNPRNILKRNDIAMLRLAATPSYTDFVRPICLPTVDITENFPENSRLFVAGWGARNETSNVKNHADLPFKTLEVCQQAYDSPKRRIQLWDNHVCAGGELGKNTCIGNGGGPLMYYDINHFELIGISSFGPNPCRSETVPSVYTKVFPYMTWIRSNIQP